MPTRRRYWLLKSEPDVFSFDDLQEAPAKRTLWDGVRNYQARNFLRDEMRVGDGVLYYHSNADPPGVAGVARVAREGYPDPTQFDPSDAHFDPESDPDDPRWYVVDVEAVVPAGRFVTLADIRAQAELGDMALVQRGQRLSVQPVTPEEWRVVLRLMGVSGKVRW